MLYPQKDKAHRRGGLSPGLEPLVRRDGDARDRFILIYPSSLPQDYPPPRADSGYNSVRARVPRGEYRLGHPHGKAGLQSRGRSGDKRGTQILGKSKLFPPFGG